MTQAAWPSTVLWVAIFDVKIGQGSFVTAWRLRERRPRPDLPAGRPFRQPRMPKRDSERGQRKCGCPEGMAFRRSLLL